MPQPKEKARSAPLALSLLSWTLQTLGGVAPRLGGGWAHRLWYRTQRYAPTAREQAWLRAAPPVPFIHESKSLWLSKWGAGPTILLMHGWGGSAVHMTDFVAPLVEAGFKVVAFDAPGHGRSPGRRTTLPEISSAIAAIADRFGPVHGIVAHSFGVCCSLHAMHHGVDVQRFVGISAPATIDGLVEKFSRQLALSTAVTADVRRRIEARFGADVWLRFAPQVLAAHMRTPALLLHDAEDRQVPSTEGAAIAAAWPQSRLEITRGLGHRRILHDAEVIQRIVRFMSATPPS